LTSLSTDALSTGETVNSLISLRAADAKEETGQTETGPQTIVDLHQQGGSLQALGIPAFIVEDDDYRFGG
jgi:hypothetical protein